MVFKSLISNLVVLKILCVFSDPFRSSYFTLNTEFNWSSVNYVDVFITEDASGVSVLCAGSCSFHESCSAFAETGNRCFLIGNLMGNDVIDVNEIQSLDVRVYEKGQNTPSTVIEASTGKNKCMQACPTI